MIECILCPAIWVDDGKQYPHQPENISSGLVYCGYRHCSIFPQVGGLVAERKKLGILEQQGFLTNINRFVGRAEAAIIAYAAQQIKERKNNLFSEDLY